MTIGKMRFSCRFKVGGVYVGTVFVQQFCSVRSWTGSGENDGAVQFERVDSEFHEETIANSRAKGEMSPIVKVREVCS